MTTIVRNWFARLVYPHRETDEARVRVNRDRRRAEVHAKRIEKGADALIERVRVNHISEHVERALRRAR